MKGFSRRILLCVPLRSFFIRESLCKQLPSIDWDVRSERCTLLMELLIEPGPEIADKRFWSADRVLSLTEKRQNRGQEVQQAVVESLETVVVKT